MADITDNNNYFNRDIKALYAIKNHSKIIMYFSISCGRTQGPPLHSRYLSFSPQSSSPQVMADYPGGLFSDELLPWRRGLPGRGRRR